MQDRSQIDDLTRQGHAAAVALALRLGLPAGRTDVLSSRGNLLIRLAAAAGPVVPGDVTHGPGDLTHAASAGSAAPAEAPVRVQSVVARVATLSAWSRRDPLAWLAREVAVAGYVASRGGPAVAPARAADPGPHWQDEFAISLWEEVPPEERRPSPAETGAALAALHLAARGCPARLGYLSTAYEHVSDGIATLDRHSVCDQETIAALRSAHASVLAGLEPVGGTPIVLHGDAHAGNLLGAACGGWTWIDLEETCRGPAEWDLACMISPYNEAGDRQAALEAYAAAAQARVPDEKSLWPYLRARMLEGAVWSLCMAHLFPARYRSMAAELLVRVLGSRP